MACCEKKNIIFIVTLCMANIMNFASEHNFINESLSNDLKKVQTKENEPLDDATLVDETSSYAYHFVVVMWLYTVIYTGKVAMQYLCGTQSDVELVQYSDEPKVPSLSCSVIAVVGYVLWRNRGGLFHR